LKIASFDERTHLQQLRDCVVELQDFECSLDPRLPCGSDIVDAYVPQMLQRCESCDGQIFVAEDDGKVAGYVTILTKVSSGELEDGNIEYGLVADLLVRQEWRGAGLGRKLLAAAENYAIDHHVKWLRVAALAGNRSAGELYKSMGFSDLFVEFEKSLSAR
jgi:GNAT superfamily N-acetyltransferase